MLDLYLQMTQITFQFDDSFFYFVNQSKPFFVVNALHAILQPYVLGGLEAYTTTSVSINSLKNH